MRKLTFIWMLGLLMLGQLAVAQEVLTRLTVDMNGFALGKEAALRGNGDSFVVKTDAEGKAHFELPLAEPAYFTLSISSSENSIYLLPGKDLFATLVPEYKTVKGVERKTFNLYQLLLKFEGEAAPINEFLNGFVMEELPDSTFLLEQSAYIKEMEKVIERNRKAINKFKLDKRFKESEFIRMKYRILEGLTRYPIQHYWKGGNQMGLIYFHGEDMSVIHDYLTSELKDDEHLWKEKSYRDFFGKAVGTLVGLYGKKHIDKMFLARLERVSSFVKSEVIMEDYVQELALNYVEAAESDSLRSLYAAYERYVKKQAYRDELQNAMSVWKKSGAGAEFAKADSVYVDIDGKPFSLAGLKGKYVYIDVWATWCGPCRQELPYLKKLEEKFHGKNIAFVSISVDSRQKDWARMVERNQMTGIQLYGGAQAPIMIDYKIEGIPRFFLIDREGRIINSDMTRPSDPTTEKFLNELEGI